jgi:hypothetical protein
MLAVCVLGDWLDVGELLTKAGRVAESGNKAHLQ